MVAFSGPDPIGVLIGAKRPSGTLVHTIAVHPDHVRQGHGRHLLTSLASKLAILGPPWIVAEVPETLVPACGLFGACGYVEEVVLKDYRLQLEDLEPRAGGGTGSFVIPITVDDLDANGLLGDAERQVCWKRAAETLTARKDEIEGLAMVSDERIDAYLLYIKDGTGAEVIDFRCFFDDGGAPLLELLGRLRAQGIAAVLFPRVHPEEITSKALEQLGLRPVHRHRLYATKAGSD